MYMYVYSTVESLYCGNHSAKKMCPHYRGVLISEVIVHKSTYTIGTSETVLIIEVSLFQRLLYTKVHIHTIGTSETVLIREVPLRISEYVLLVWLWFY